MTCGHARLQIGADPRSVTPELEDHLRSCPACSDFRREMTRLEEPIRRALEAGPLAGQAPGKRASPARRWALAASLMVAFTAGMLFWTLRPPETLAADIVAHLAHEPESWSQPGPVPPSALELVVREAGLDIDPSETRVVYARSCPFRGHSVPHLVVRTAEGPLTVLVLRSERVEAAERFSEGGFAGLLLPSSAGTLAVIARGNANLERAVGEIRTIFGTELSASR